MLQADGYINKPYFGVLAAKNGPYITNEPHTFPHDYAAERIERCVNTQAAAQTVHDSTILLDAETVQACVGQKVTPSLSHRTYIAIIASDKRSLHPQDVQRRNFLLTPEFAQSPPEQEKIVSVLPTIGFMNMPGPPGECGGTMFGKVREPTMKPEA